MKTLIAVWCVAILVVPGIAAPVGEASPAAKHSRLGSYARKIFNPEAAARAGAAAGYGTAVDHPHEWGGGALGFARRAGSAFGQHIVKGTIEFAVAGLHHDDLRYHRSDLEGTWPRLKYAVESTFWVPRTQGSGKTVAAGRIAGDVGSGLISRAWQPASGAALGWGLASGGIGIGADVGFNVVREFWPWGKSRH